LVTFYQEKVTITIFQLMLNSTFANYINNSLPQISILTMKLPKKYELRIFNPKLKILTSAYFKI